MKIQLSENQVKNLIKGYKTLNEQESPQLGSRTQSWEVNFDALWAPGKWKLTGEHQNKLKPELTKITTYLTKHPNTKLNIQIVASESKVPNYDREQSGNVKVPEGYLSNKRGESLQNVLVQFFKQFKLENSVVIPKPITKIGGPSYGGDDANQKKYTDHQYVKLIINGTYSIECLIGMKITIKTLGTKDGHNCDRAIFDVLVNGVSLGVANLNNGKLDIGDQNAILRAQTGRSQNRIKQTIQTRNRLNVQNQYSKTLAKEIMSSIREQSKNGELRRNKDFVWEGKPISEWLREFNIKSDLETYSDIIRLLNAYYVKYEPVKISGYVSEKPDTVITNDMIKSIPILDGYEGQTLKQVFDPGTDMITTAKNIKGRQSDGRYGGARSQTFILDTNKAQSIVDQSKTKDRLKISIKPLIDSSGPYKVFHTSSGVHTEVPRVEIVGKDGDVRYPEQMPNKGKLDGLNDETDILTVDICGKPIQGQ